MGGWGCGGGVRGGWRFRGKNLNKKFELVTFSHLPFPNLKYLSSALAPTSGIGTMGTTDPDYGGVGMGTGARLRVAANLFTNFDFSTACVDFSHEIPP